MAMVTVMAVALVAQLLPNAPVPALDLTRYSGEWHEIARFEQWFQRKCERDVSATYTLHPDGTIGVLNRCRTRDGTLAEAEGVARQAGAPGALEVSFAPAWLAWLPWVWGDYWIIDLDPDYRWALVGGPSRDYLWILSRSPTLDAATMSAMVESARARGYDVARLIASNR